MTKFHDGATPVRWTGPATADKSFSVMWRLWLAMAVCLFGAAAASPSLDVLFLRFAALTTGGAVLFYAASGEGRRPERRVHRDGATVRVGMRPTLPVATVAFAVSLPLFAFDPGVFGDLRLLLISAGSLLPLLLVPDLVRVIIEGGGVAMDPVSLRVSSLSTDYQVDWADVVMVYVLADRMRRPLQRGRTARRSLTLPTPTPRSATAS